MDKVSIVVTFYKDGKFTGQAARTISDLEGMRSNLQKPHEFMKHIDLCLDDSGVEVYEIPGTSMF